MKRIVILIMIFSVVFCACVRERDEKAVSDSGSGAAASGMAAKPAVPDSMVTISAISGSVTAKETNMPDVQKENPHEAYKSAMEKSNNNINHIDKNGVFENPYVYYDIDKDGIDELIVTGGYYAYRVFTYQNGELIDLWSSKYGGDEILIYPDKGVVFFSSGHQDYYADTYIQISKSKVKVVAEKSWHVIFLSETKTRTENKYTVMGASVKKSKYEAYVKSLKKEKVVTHNQLEWKNK